MFPKDRRRNLEQNKLTASAGFGKTTLLAHALEQNRLDPSGIDLWIGCEARDDAESLAQSIVDGLAAVSPQQPRSAGVRIADSATPTDPVAAVVEAVWALAPSEVCIVLDDLHFASGEATFVDALIERLPLNGHLVLCSRQATNECGLRIRLGRGLGRDGHQRQTAARASCSFFPDR